MKVRFDARKFIDDSTGDSGGPTSAIGRMGIDGNSRL